MNACTVMKLRGNYARMFNEDFFFGRFSKISKLDFWRFFSLMVDIEYTYLVQPSYQVKPGFETIYNTFILIYIVLRVAYTPR